MVCCSGFRCWLYWTGFRSLNVYLPVARCGSNPDVLGRSIMIDDSESIFGNTFLGRPTGLLTVGAMGLSAGAGWGRFNLGPFTAVSILLDIVGTRLGGAIRGLPTDRPPVLVPGRGRPIGRPPRPGRGPLGRPTGRLAGP